VTRITGTLHEDHYRFSFDISLSSSWSGKYCRQNLWRKSEQTFYVQYSLSNIVPFMR